MLALTVKIRKSQDFLAPISGSPGDQFFSLTFRNSTSIFLNSHLWSKFVCVEVLRPSQPNGVMSSAVSLPNHTFTGQA